MHQFIQIIHTAILGTVLLTSSIYALPVKPSISGDVFFKMFEGKNEAALRKDAIWRMTEIATRYPETSFAKEAREVVQADAKRTDPHAWIADTMKVVGNALCAYPPSDDNWQIRREAFLLLDYPLHVETGDEFHRAITDFYRPFLDKAFKEIRSTRITEGARIWHIYNMGFVVKTKNHTIAFDIFPRETSPGGEWISFLTEQQTRELAQMADVAFVSHWHDDHANVEFLKAVSTAGKKVIVPDPIEETFKSDLMGMSGIIPIRSTPEGAPMEFDGIQIYCYPGFQGDLPCNVYVVKVDGIVISQNGDNCLHSIYADIAKQHSIDIALANCWSGTNEYICSINPKLFITGHENELHHDIIHRVPYRNTYGNLDALELTPPWKPDQTIAAVLSCGEGIQWSSNR